MSYFDGQAGTYAKRSRAGLWGAWRALETRAVLRHLEGENGQRILDAGCGTGFYMEAVLRRFPGAVLEGFDISPAMAEAGRAAGLSTICSGFETFTSNAPFDRILCAGMLEFVEEPRMFFNRSAEWLRESGRLVILVPGAGAMGLLYRRFHSCRGSRVFLREPAEYNELAARSGFRLRGSSSLGGFSQVLGWSLG